VPAQQSQLRRNWPNIIRLQTEAAMFRLAWMMCSFVMAVPAMARDEVRDWPPAGISMVKPADWHDVTPEDMERTFAKGTSNIPQEHRGPPVAVINFAKFKEPYRDLNPGVNVTLYPPAVANVPIADIIRSLEETKQTINEGMKLVSGPTLVMVGGKPATHLKFKHTVTLTTLRAAAIYEMWAISLPHVHLVIGGSYREDEANGGSADIQRILRTVTFANSK
jgi:hypothetical protein